MKYFLAKSEPHVYSIGDFQKDMRTIWDGIKNPQALQAVRNMTPGDRVFIYHSGGHSAVVGLAQVVSEPRPDPNDAKSAVVELEYVCHLDPPTSLADIKKSNLFNDWALVRQSRLSTMQAPPEFVEWLRRIYPAANI